MGKLAAKLLRRWAGPVEELPPDPTVASLQAELDRLRAQVADVQLQWAEVLDKIAAWGNRQAARDRARVRDALKAPQSDEELVTDPTGGDEGERGSAGLPAPANGTGGETKADLWARARARGIR